MARNEEKAKSMLNMFLRRHEIGRIEEKRPTNTMKVTSAKECEKWRTDITREIIAEVTAIQSTGLGEQVTREKNDYINDLLKKRYFWEVRIMELAGLEYAESIGIDASKERIRREKERIKQQKEEQQLLQGKNLKKRKNQIVEDEKKLRQLQKDEQHRVDLRSMGLSKDADGGAVIGVNGYYYFGAAKLLPGVRELYEQRRQEQATVIKRGELLSRVDASYYGYQEDDNLALLRQEEEYEKLLLKKALKQKKRDEEKKLRGDDRSDNDGDKKENNLMNDDHHKMNQQGMIRNDVEVQMKEPQVLLDDGVHTYQPQQQDHIQPVENENDEIVQLGTH